MTTPPSGPNEPLSYAFHSPARGVAADLGRDGTVIVTSDGVATELAATDVSASDDDDVDVPADVTRDSADTVGPDVVTVGAVVVAVVLVELNVVNN